MNFGAYPGFSCSAKAFMLLSVVMPVYNERHTLGVILTRVAACLPGVAKEIIIVDDNSHDGTREWLRANFPHGERRARK